MAGKPILDPGIAPDGVVEPKYLVHLAA